MKSIKPAENVYFNVFFFHVASVLIQKPGSPAQRELRWHLVSIGFNITIMQSIEFTLVAIFILH